MASQAMDPVTAAINYLDTLASGVLNLFALKGQKKIVKQQGVNLDKMTEQERLRYYEAIQDGNTLLASKLLDNIQNKGSSENVTTWIIVGLTFLIVLAVIYVKFKPK